MELVDALTERNLDGLKSILVKRPAAAQEPTPQGISPLTLALYMRYDDAVEMLRTVVEPDVFEAAILGDQAACLRQLKDPDACGPDGFTALHLAAHFGHAGLVDTLIEQGCSVSRSSAQPLANQPLHAAAAGGSVEAIQALLGQGADIDATDGSGSTPLMIATVGRCADAVQVLLDAGADPHAENNKRQTALMLAVDRDYPELVTLLSRPR